MAARYVPISEADMRAELADMGFEQVPNGKGELTFQRQVKETHYAIRIYTTIVHGESRDCGEDAIRVLLINTKTDRPVKVLDKETTPKPDGSMPKAGCKVLRTKSALTNMRERARDYWRHVAGHPCPECGSVMAVRTNRAARTKFLGCTNYPDCSATGQLS